MFSVKLPAVNIGALYFGAWRRAQCISLLRLGRGITLPLAIKPLSELRHMQSVKLVGLLPAILGCISGIDTPFCSEHLTLKRTQHPCLPYCIGLLLSCCRSCLCCLQSSFWNFCQVMAKYILPNGNIWCKYIMLKSNTSHRDTNLKYCPPLNAAALSPDQ